MADGKGYRRIAFPAIGTGGMKYPAEVLALCLLQQVNSFQGNNLKNVDLVLHHSDASTISVSCRFMAKIGQNIGATITTIIFVLVLNLKQAKYW